jgi:hypothetical protein
MSEQFLFFDISVELSLERLLPSLHFDYSDVEQHIRRMH